MSGGGKEQVRAEMTQERVMFPLKLYKPGREWLVELNWLTDREGHESVCGLFHSIDYESAKSFYDNAHEILSCWYVERVFVGEGKPPINRAWYEKRAAIEEDAIRAEHASKPIPPWRDGRGERNR